MPNIKSFCPVEAVKSLTNIFWTDGRTLVKLNAYKSNIDVMEKIALSVKCSFHFTTKDTQQLPVQLTLKKA
jgi:hypothetical protein